MASIFDELLKKELDRKEFLAYLGAAGLSLIGVTGLINSLTDPHAHKRASRLSDGYNDGAYGG
jgi:hypothetical protein